MPEFDQYARDYEELLRDPLRDRFTKNGNFFHQRKWILIEEFIRQHGFPAEKSAWLDVGCGKGELLSLGRKRFERTVGCDPSEQMATSAQVEVRAQSAPDQLPFEDKSFDFVTAVCVYHHVEEQHRISLTRDVHRVLRPGGVFCMIEHNPLNPVTQMIVRRTPVDANARLLTSSRSKRYMRECGFGVMSTEYFLYLPETWYARGQVFERAFQKLPLGGQYAVFGRTEKH